MPESSRSVAIGREEVLTQLSRGTGDRSLEPANCPGHDMDVDDDAGQRGWVADMGGYMRLAYPGGMGWSAVLITGGLPKDPPRPGQDHSMHNTRVSNPCAGRFARMSRYNQDTCHVYL